MRKIKLNEVKVHFTKPLPHEFTDEKGNKFKVSLQMYTGKVKYRLKGFDELLPVKAYGLNLLITIEDSDEPTSYDFGFLTPESYQLAALIYALARAEIKDFEHLRKSIRLTCSGWGDPVYDLEGDPVTEAGRLKRDPFVKAARRVLKGILTKAHKRIVDAANATKPPQNGKGVDL